MADILVAVSDPDLHSLRQAIWGLNRAGASTICQPLWNRSTASITDSSFTSWDGFHREVEDHRDRREGSVTGGALAQSSCTPRRRDDCGER